MLNLMKVEAGRSQLFALGLFAAIALLTGCSLVLGDLPPTDERGAGGDGATGGAGTTGGADSGGGSAGSAPGGGGSAGSAGMPPSCDQDGDGVESEACGGRDCNDADEAVNPGQEEFFPESHNERGSFDYNCDGDSEPEGPFVECGLVPTQCPMDGEGFLDPEVPCGEPGRWGTCQLVNMNLACAEDVRSVSRVMGCR
jgi:hypothetical protein